MIIFERGFVALQSRTGMGETNHLPLGFLVPDGDDKAALGRKDTAMRWAGKEMEPVVFDNTPISGFRILDSVVHGPSGTKWRIEDPRGFELEISSPNLMNLISHAVFDQQTILSPCIWMRDGGHNRLVPTSSKTYINAVAPDITNSEPITASKLRVGDVVVFANGRVGTYVGRVGSMSFDFGNQPRRIQITDHGFVVNKTTIYSVKNPSKMRLVSRPDVPEKASHYMGEYLADRFTSNRWGSFYAELPECEITTHRTNLRTTMLTPNIKSGIWVHPDGSLISVSFRDVGNQARVARWPSGYANNPLRDFDDKIHQIEIFDFVVTVDGVEYTNTPFDK